MAIFNSYVKLPDGKLGELLQILPYQGEHDDPIWEYSCTIDHHFSIMSCLARKIHNIDV
jgi:hypothetical protein